MPTFACRSRDASGGLVQRNVESDSESEVLRLLEADGLFPIEVRPLASGAKRAAPSKGAGGGGARAARRARGVGAERVDRRIARKELLKFTMQLSSSLSAGVPILVALEAIARQTPNPSFVAVLRQMIVDLEGGASLSEALTNHPKTFTEVYASTVAAGEQSGNLTQVLDNLTEYTEIEIEVSSDVRAALLYPAMVVVTLGLAITALVLFVIPRFASFYSSFGSDLPLPTRILIAVSTAVTSYFPLVALGCAALAFGFFKFQATPTGKRAVDAFLLRVPVVKLLIHTINTLQVTQMIGLFTQAGVPIVQGLRTVARTSFSPRIRASLEAVADDVATGASLGASMEARECLPPTARQMLAAGESTGSLEQSCFAVSKYFKKELHYLTKNLATLIEPLLTLALAVIVLFVALAVFLPMWDLVKVVRN